MEKFLKKRKYFVYVAILVLAATSVIFTKPKTAEATVNGMVNATNVNVRSGPGTDYPVLQYEGKDVQLQAGHKVNISYVERNVWYYITTDYEGMTITGYISSEYVSADKKAVPSAMPTKVPTPAPTDAPIYPCSGIVAADLLNVRTGAGVNYETIGRLTDGDSVVIQSESVSEGQKWYSVFCIINKKLVSGYVSAAYIKLDTKNTGSDSAKPTVTAAPSAGNAYAIDGDKIIYRYTGRVSVYMQNLRSGAGTSYQVVTALSRDDVVTVVNEVNVDGLVWFRVIAEKNGLTYEGYMLSNYIDIDYGSGIPSVPYGTTLRFKSEPASSALYVRTNTNNVITCTASDTFMAVEEVTANGVKWIKIAYTALDGTVYYGYTLRNNFSFKSMYAKPTPTPTSAGDRPSPTPTPTRVPGTTSGYYNLEYHDASEAPLNAPGTPKGVGINNEYVPERMFLYRMPGDARAILDSTDEVVWIEKGIQFELYDCYTYNGINYRHMAYTNSDGVTYYGYMPEYAIFVVKGEAGDVSIWGRRLAPNGEDNESTMGQAIPYETQLKMKGFPDSYIPYLVELHKLHPNWIFEAQDTGLDWTAALNAEDKVGKNLVPNSYASEYKSKAAGAYDSTTGKYVVFDGSTWVTASREAIAYYMDPRNFLDETRIFMFENLLYNSEAQTEAGVNNILSGTALADKSFTYVDSTGNTVTTTYAQTFMDAAKYSMVSPYHLASRVKQEVVTNSNATGLSNSVSGTVAGYEGLYNFFNIGAYHSTTAGGAIVNGLKYAKYGSSSNYELNQKSLIPWTDPHRSIVGGSYIIGYNYIMRGQNTIYLQKWNMTSTSTYSHQYMSNIEAPYSEAKKVATAYKDVKDAQIVFSIPVFDNMPTQNAPEPKAGSSSETTVGEAELATLWLTDAISKKVYEVSPTFNGAVTDYTVNVDKTTVIVSFMATAADDSSQITGLNNLTLKEGTTTAQITVTSANGVTKTYTIKISK